MRTRGGSVPFGTELGKHMRQNLPLIFLSVVFIAGSLCGSALYSTLSEETSNTLMLLLSGTQPDSAFHFGACLGSVFLSHFLMMLLLFLCGFCAIGQPIVIFLPFVKGLGFGLVAACNAVLLSPYSAFFWLKFLPGAFLGTVLLLLCARTSLDLSLFVHRAVFTAAAKEGRFRVTAYWARYVGFLLLCAVFSLISATLDLIYAVVSAA